MPKYSYVAMDSRARKPKGVLEVANQTEASDGSKRWLLSDQGDEVDKDQEKARPRQRRQGGSRKKKADVDEHPHSRPGKRCQNQSPYDSSPAVGDSRRCRPSPLRGLRVLESRSEIPTLNASSVNRVAIDRQHVLRSLASIQVFNRLFVNMVKAGEIGGVLEVSCRLPNSWRRRRRLKASHRGHVLPDAVITVAVIILAGPHGLVIPKFKDISGHVAGRPARLHQFVLNISDAWPIITS
jgi:type IV pilus assembly protein PilC